jgi:hypothetical protein
MFNKGSLFNTLLELSPSNALLGFKWLKLEAKFEKDWHREDRKLFFT